MPALRNLRRRRLQRQQQKSRKIKRNNDYFIDKDKDRSIFSAVFFNLRHYENGERESGGRATV